MAGERFDKPIPKEAIDFFAAKKLTIGFDWRDIWREEHAYMFTVAKAMQVDILEDLHSAVASAIAEGKTFAQFQKELRPILEQKGWWGVQDMVDPLTSKTVAAQLGSPRRLRIIYDANVRTARAAGAWSRIQRTKDLMPYLLYQLGPSRKHRPEHEAINNTLLSADDPWWSIYYPPNGYRCFTPDTLVAGDFDIGLKSFYSGKIRKIFTRSGAYFTVTANHPVLSENGWVEADMLNKGDNLLRHTGVVNSAAPIIINNQNPPATAKERFESLASDAFGICKMSSFDFHGDTKFREGDVYVSGADCVLMDNFKSLPLEQLEQGDFKWADDGGVSRKLVTNSLSAGNVATKKTFAINDSFYHWSGAVSFIDYLCGTKSFCVQMNHLFFKVIIPRVRSLPSRLTLLLNLFRVKFHSLPQQGAGLALCASSNSSVFQHSSNGESTNTVSSGNRLFALAREICRRNVGIIKLLFSDADSGKSSLFNKLCKDKPADSVTFTDFMKRHHGQVVIDDIISIEDSFYSGHVYTFQSKNEIIVANGIITHNCKCWVRQVSRAEYADLSENEDYVTESPEIETVEWVNKRTGAVEQVPKGITPGWDTNAGQIRLAGVATKVADRLSDAAVALALINALKGEE